MISLTALAISVLWAVAALSSGTRATPAAARRTAACWATGLLAVSLIPAVARPADPLGAWLGLPIAAWAPGTALAAVCVCGLLATALAPAADHPPRTVALVCLLFAAATGHLAVRHPVADALLWACSIALAWPFLRGPGYLMAQAAGMACAGWGVPLGALARSVAWTTRAPMAVLVAVTAVPVHATALPTPVRTAAAAFAAVAAAYALAQVDVRRVLAGLALSLNGFLLAGVAWQALAIAVSGLAMTTAALEARRGGLSLAIPNGSLTETPRLAVAFLVFGLAAVGFPPLLGFAGVHHAIEATPLLALAAAVNGITVLRAFLRLFGGVVHRTGEHDLTRMERYAVTIAAATLVAGVLV
ncbi:hypothetical protein [Actinokineospora fastidiosa]|uniref:NADH:quinone oxidoreductase/Mrp antiporter membrane subunit domain-containing protein n=1 Tax=Actinokineospora fastidiosa TaxID=1816 RepID=A0A918LHX3_9PSEU|nr:hypothetical protein [Actinokineospora fastidiosa]GGS53405.1 hypothetical protein GCM10010171_55910 [Actinokineospora fastidiosa]